MTPTLNAVSEPSAQAHVARASVALPDALGDALAARIAARLGSPAQVSPWLSADEAASYLRCPISRVRKLTMTGDLPSHRDGRRVLYNRAELDEFIRSGGAFAL